MLATLFTIIKPLWIWGIVASSIAAVPSSALVLRSINKDDPKFKDYYNKRGKIKNFLHTLKSIGKSFIPIYNVFHGFVLFHRLFNMGSEGLRDKWEDRIKRTDNLLDDAKRIGYNTKRIAVGLVNKAKNRSKNKEVVETPTKKEEPVKTITTNTPVKQVATVQNTKPVVQATKPVVKTNTQPVDMFTELTRKLDELNASNMPTDQLLKMYTNEYWKTRKRYDELKSKGLDVTTEFKKLVILHDKCLECKQIRNVSEKPMTLARK